MCFKKKNGLSVNEKGVLVVNSFTLATYLKKKTDVVIPTGCKNIPDYAFEKADGRFFIGSVVFPDGLQRIGSFSISHTQIRSLSLPSSLKEIAKFAICNCEKLENVVLPEGLQKIGESAFSSCKNLSKIRLPNSLTYLGTKAFNETPISTIAITSNIKRCGIPCKNVQIDSIKQWLSIEHEDNLIQEIHHNPDYTEAYRTGTLYEYKLFIGKELLRDVVIPEGITTIKAHTFEGSNVESFKFPSTLRVIQDHAIDCPKLERLELPDGFKRIEGHDRSCDFNTPSIIRTDYVFKRLNYVRVPDSIEYFDFQLANECELEIEDPRNGFNGQYASDMNAVLYLGNENNPYVVAIKCVARNDLRPDGVDMSKINVPSGCRVIVGWAFSEVEAESITLPETIVTIHARAFVSSKNLKDVLIPSSVQELGPQLFADCNKLHKVRYGGTKAQWEALTNKDCSRRWMYNSVVEKVECTDGIIRVED